VVPAAADTTSSSEGAECSEAVKQNGTHDGDGDAGAEGRQPDADANTIGEGNDAVVVDTAAGRSEDEPGRDRGASPPECYFIVHNIAKKHNVGTLARCATAFGIKSVCLIGSKSYNTFGCKGASNHMDFSYYPTLTDARKGLMQEKGVTKIIGVEIVEGAVPIEDHPFDGNTAFIMGNEGDGMTATQKEICDGFVYIRQYGPGTASLNVAVAASIVMHHFGLWARYAERDREGEKYVVAARSLRRHARGVVGMDPDAVRASRAAAAKDPEEDESEDLEDVGEALAAIGWS